MEGGFRLNLGGSSKAPNESEGANSQSGSSVFDLLRNRKAKLRSDTLNPSSKYQETASEEGSFRADSLTLGQLAAMVSHWYCAAGCANYCKRVGGFGGHARHSAAHGTRAAADPARALSCGHFICKNCAESESFTMIPYSCPVLETGIPCGISNTSGQMGSLRPANHVNKYVRVLAATGVQCKSACLLPAGSPLISAQYPKELCLLCETCAIDMPSMGLAEQQVVGMCFYCKKEGGTPHASHNFVPLSAHARFARQLTIEGRAGLASRSPWHLKMFGPTDLTSFMREVLTCTGCDFTYNSSEPSRTPRLLQCGHTVCSKCAARCTNGQMACPFSALCPRTLTVPPCKDLAWARIRSPTDFSTCSSCNGRHVHELMGVTTGQTRAAAPICLLCLHSS